MFDFLKRRKKPAEQREQRRPTTGGGYGAPSSSSSPSYSPMTDYLSPLNPVGLYSQSYDSSPAPTSYDSGCSSSSPSYDSGSSFCGSD